MIVIYNRYIPTREYWALNLFGLIFVREDYGKLDPVMLNHEYIHTLQQREMLWIPFYVWYLVEWFCHLLRFRDSKKAYRAIHFEREAYDNARDKDYVRRRKHYAWLRNWRILDS